MINHDKLAQYWMPFGHISYYERVDIDRLISETFGRDANESETPELRSQSLVGQTSEIRR